MTSPSDTDPSTRARELAEEYRLGMRPAKMGITEAFEAGYAAGQSEMEGRLEIVNSTNRLKQMTIHELQNQRDAANQRIEGLREALVRISYHNTYASADNPIVKAQLIAAEALKDWGGENE